MQKKMRFGNKNVFCTTFQYNDKQVAKSKKHKKKFAAKPVNAVTAVTNAVTAVTML